MKVQDLKRLTILIVDDDEVSLRVILNMLKGIFKYIYVAKDGKEALSLFKLYRPNLVLTDIYMPTINGLELAREIKRIDVKTPIVISSISYQHKILLKAINLGIDNYIVKPIDRGKLLNILRKTANTILKNRAIERKNRYIKALFDAQPDIVIVTDGKRLKSANRSFFDFFTQFKDLKDFKKNHKCITELFEKIERYGTVYDNVYNENWIEFILKNEKDIYKAFIKKDDILYSFKLTVKSIEESEDSSIYIVNLTDITKTEEYKHKLEHKIVEEVNKNRKKEQIMFHQSKLASMGEMMNNIAHQWRQPLNALGLIIQDLEFAYEYDELNDEYIEDVIYKSMKQINFMSKTIDDFRNFFKPNKKRSPFNLYSAISDAISIIESTFKHYNININFNSDGNLIVNSFSNELSQVVLNILNNSKDALLDNNITTPKISILIDDKSKFAYLSIIDNAGGVSDKIIDKIFEPYFTTKEQGKGTGIGLYMSKIIIENNIKGSLFVENIELDKEVGAKFTIKIPKEEI